MNSDVIIVDNNLPSVGMGYNTTMNQQIYMDVPLQTRQDYVYM